MAEVFNVQYSLFASSRSDYVKINVSQRAFLLNVVINPFIRQ